jgi:biotin transporter BioY
MTFINKTPFVPTGLIDRPIFIGMFDKTSVVLSVFIWASGGYLISYPSFSSR